MKLKGLYISLVWIWKRRKPKFVFILYRRNFTLYYSLAFTSPFIKHSHVLENSNHKWEMKNPKSSTIWLKAIRYMFFSPRSGNQYYSANIPGQQNTVCDVQFLIMKHLQWTIFPVGLKRIQICYGKCISEMSQLESLHPRLKNKKKKRKEKKNKRFEYGLEIVPKM